MLFKYYIKFDEEGEVGCFCKSKPSDCFEDCNEYLVKLIPIDRELDNNNVEKFVDSVSCLSQETSRLTSEIKKARNKLRRSFK